MIATEKKATIRLAGDRVMVRILEWGTNRRTKGGLALPDTADKRELCARAEVVAIGTGFVSSNGVRFTVEDLIPGICVGARVAITRNGVNEQPIQLNLDEYMILRSNDVVGVVEDEGQEVTRG